MVEQYTLRRLTLLILICAKVQNAKVSALHNHPLKGAYTTAAWAYQQCYLGRQGLQGLNPLQLTVKMIW